MSSSTKRVCMPTYCVQSRVNVFRQAPVNVCQASNLNPMSANIVKVIFNQESMYANLSRVKARVRVKARINVCQASNPNPMSANVVHVIFNNLSSVPQTRVNVCQASKPNSMSANIVNVIFNQESVYANLLCPK